jgi:hypothetical protein
VTLALHAVEAEGLQIAADYFDRLHDNGHAAARAISLAQDMESLKRAKEDWRDPPFFGLHERLVQEFVCERIRCRRVYR